ncbi:MAG: hypothetical protein ISP49_07475 [Reyranella sp.]|nr:hypothetical protein [Reyranella sp.]MBL6651416.1 hypothetical protein [Reyranella sp.]
MPLYWTIDSRAKLVTLVAEGEVSLDEAVACLAAVEGASATPIASCSTAAPASRR